MTKLALPYILVTREVYNRGFIACSTLPTAFVPVVIPARSTDEDHLNGIRYAAGDIFIPGDISEIAGGGPRGADMMVVQLEPEAQRDLAAMLGLDQLIDLLRSGMVRHQGAPEQRAAFHGFLASLLQEDMWAPVSSSDRMAARRDQILEDLAALFGDPGAVGLPSRRERRSNRTRLAHQARAYLEANLDRVVGLSELCRFTGTSARTIQYAFRDQYGVSPKVYHSARRLNVVRQSLKQRWLGETTVTDVAMAHGFWHLGRFSQAYNKLFGESPSETLARRPTLRRSPIRSSR